MHLPLHHPCKSMTCPIMLYWWQPNHTHLVPGGTRIWAIHAVPYCGDCVHVYVYVQLLVSAVSLDLLRS